MPLPYGYQVASIALEPGQLVMFPSWFLHDVKPFEGEGTRITIAFKTVGSRCRTPSPRNKSA